MAFCPSCGTVVEQDAGFCTACGRSLSENPGAKSEADGHTPDGVTLGSLSLTGRVRWPAYLDYLGESDMHRLGNVRLPDEVPIGFVAVGIMGTRPLKLLLSCYDKPIGAGGRIVRQLSVSEAGSTWVAGW